MLDYILYIGGTIFIILYGAMPILIWSQNKLPEKYNLVSVPEEEFLSESTEALKSLHTEINANDFHCVGASVVDQQATKTRFMLFTHHTKKLSILLTQISNPNVPTVVYVETAQLFDDNTMLNVMNAPMAGAYPKSSHKVTFRFPEIIEVARLVDITERIIGKYLSSKVAVALPKGGEREMVEELLNEELAGLIAKGYVQDSVEDNLRSLTFKGAYLMTWKMLWPVKQIREYRDVAFSKKILSEL